jgi:hypothetical protein
MEDGDRARTATAQDDRQVRAVNLGERPDLAEPMQELISQGWPEFMFHDAVGERLWERLASDFPTFQVLLLDRRGLPVGVGNSIPFVWNGTIGDLPSGWDDVLEQGVRDRGLGRRPTAVSAVSVTMARDQVGRGLSREVVAALKRNAAEHGFGRMVVPVRPNRKAAYPLTPMDRYVRWTRADGSPFDPWLRVHWRLGASILDICPASMVVTGTVAEWESWTGMAFPESGAYVVPEALVPVLIDRELDEGRYAEPNVWLRHPLDDRSAASSTSSGLLESA